MARLHEQLFVGGLRRRRGRVEVSMLIARSRRRRDGYVGGSISGLLVARLLARAGEGAHGARLRYTASPTRAPSLERRQKQPDAAIHTEFASGILSLVI